MAAAKRIKVLFLCTGNSCRSQMGEGWARALKGSEVEAYSAGTQPHGLNPLAVRAMREAGVDISGHTSKRPEDLGVEFDVVVTVCDSAHESCPLFPGARVVHVGFDDPPRLARGEPSEELAMRHYRRVRDEIKAFVETLPDSILKGVSMQRETERSKPCCEPGCCGGPGDKAKSHPLESSGEGGSFNVERVRSKVREGYSKIAQVGTWSEAKVGAAGAGGCCGTSASGGCCGPTSFTPDQLATAIGYSQGELTSVPEGANMGLSCGNPTAIAGLKAGEVVLDLGSGGGFDCFIAGPKVGATGRIIGVDMTPDMLSKARRNITMYNAQTGLNNVEFRLGEIEHLPVADASVDVVISNCVLNLSPDKSQVWREIARVLKAGGRVAVSDLALLRPLPEAVREDMEALVGCVAGAVLVEETRRQMERAGLVNISLVSKPEYVDAMTDWQDPLYQRIVAALPRGTKASDFITSLDISGVKARGA